MIRIFVDADACPVKEETLRVARRYQLHVIFVANTALAVPKNEHVHMIVVPGNLDAADDWIAENSAKNDIVITTDIPLAARCINNGSTVIDSRGGIFTEDRIGEALASREILSQLREQGIVTGGPKSFSNKHSSLYLQRLDREIQAIIKRQRREKEKEKD